MNSPWIAAYSAAVLSILSIAALCVYISLSFKNLKGDEPPYSWLSTYTMYEEFHLSCHTEAYPVSCL
jgi:hypothetical protein